MHSPIWIAVPRGATAPGSPAFRSINVPWYGVLGNHEYGYDVDAQIQLSHELRWR